MKRRVPLAMLLGVFLPCAILSAPTDEQLPKPKPAPRFAIVLKERHGHATPERMHNTRTGGGNIDVVPKGDDLVIVTMTGVAVAGPHPCRTSSAEFGFEVNQCFEIVTNNTKLKKGKLTMEAAIIGLLRGDKNGGSAAIAPASAAVTAGPVLIVSVAFEGHAIGGGDNLSINDHKGPVSVPVQPGVYHLVQTFRIGATHARGVCGTAAAAEFAPDPALDPLWISYTDPFHGAVKKEFGFRVSLRVEPE